MARLIFLFSFFLALNPSHAQVELLGGEVSYEQQSKSRFRVRLSVWKYCDTNVLKASDIRTELSNACTSLTATPVFLKTDTINNGVCASLQRNCQSTTIGRPILAYRFVLNLNFDSLPFRSLLSSCCTVSVNFTASSLQTTTGPGTQPLCLNATIEACMKSIPGANSSGNWLSNPRFYEHANRAFVYNPAHFDGAFGDSLVFEAYDRCINRGYTSFNPQLPFSIHCVPAGSGCTPNINAVPPRGNFWDARNGDIIFTPITAGQKAPLGQSVKRFRRDSSGQWKYLGLTTRIMSIKIDTSIQTQNLPPVFFSSILAASVCGNDSVKGSVDARDNMASGQRTADTVRLRVVGTIPGLKYRLRDSTTRNKILDWSYRAPNNNLPAFTFFSVHLHDAICPLPGNTQRAVTIRIYRPARNDTFKLESRGCGSYRASCATDSLHNVLWEIAARAKPGVVLLKGVNSTWDFTLPDTGEYIITRTYATSNNCRSVRRDTFRHNQLWLRDDPSFPDTIQPCLFTDLQIRVNPRIGAAYPKIQWFMGDSLLADTGSSLLLKHLQQAINLKVAFTDSNNCKAENHTKIIPRGEPIALVRQGTVCAGAANTLDPDKLFAASPAGLNWEWDSIVYKNANVQQGKLIAFQWANRHDTLAVRASYTDTNGCRFADSALLYTLPYPAVQLRSLRACRQSYIDLVPMIDSLSRRAHTATWRQITGPVFDGLVKLTNPERWVMRAGLPSELNRNGRYLLSLTLRDSLNGCLGIDSAPFTFSQPPLLKINAPGAYCAGEMMLRPDSFVRLNGQLPDPRTSYWKTLRHNQKSVASQTGWDSTRGFRLLPGSWDLLFTDSSLCLSRDTLRLFMRHWTNLRTIEQLTLCRPDSLFLLEGLVQQHPAPGNRTIFRLLSAPQKRDTNGIIAYANDSAWLLSGKRSDVDFGGKYRIAAQTRDSFGCTTTTDTSLLTFDNHSEMLALIDNPYCSRGNTLDLSMAFRLDGRRPGLYRANWELRSIASFPPYEGSTDSLIQGSVLKLPLRRSTYTIRYKSDSSACPFEDSIALYIKDNPIIYAGPDTVVTQGDPLVLQVTAQGYPFIWNDGIRNDSRTVLFEQLQQDTVYFIVRIEEGPQNCAAADTVRVIGKRLPMRQNFPELSGMKLRTLPNGLEIAHPEGISHLLCSDVQGRVLFSRNFPPAHAPEHILLDFLPVQSYCILHIQTTRGSILRLSVFVPMKE